MRDGAWRFPLVCVAGMLASVALAGCDAQSPGGGVCKMARVTALPFKVHKDHLLTNAAALNGKPAVLMIDTGSQWSSIIRSRQEKFDLHPFSTDAYLVGIGGRRRVYGLEAESFQLGALHGKNLDLTMADFRLLDDNVADGLLGADYLSGYDLDLDFSERKLLLYKVVAGCKQPVAPLEEPLYLAPLAAAPNRSDNRSPFVHVQINGRTLLAEIDSGAARTMLFPGAAHRIGLTDAILAADEHHAAAGVGPHTIKTARHVMTPMTVGEITVSNFPVYVADTRLDDGPDMLLGLDFLRRVHVFIAYSSKTLIMQYPPKPSPPAKG